MPRKARIDAPGSLQHVISRGIERRKIFQDDEDRDRFLGRLGAVLTKTGTPCYGWALMPNHFHLLLKTGCEPIANVMRRLLTGYALDFNRRHRRVGRLFQNRYKSILCQEDAYLMELIRYIHLNPIRAGLVSNLEKLNAYPFCGHSAVLGHQALPWQDTEAVLRLFDRNSDSARQKYNAFVKAGLSQGSRPDLIGGGLVRSAGGWGVINMMRQLKVHLKGDERILGDSEFVQSVLDRAEEEIVQKYRFSAKGYDLDYVIRRAASVFDVPVEEVFEPGKQPRRVSARSVAAYWAVRKLCIDGTVVGKTLGLSQSAISRAVKRGERLISDKGLSLE